ncbi:MAG: cell division protein ZapE [Alphaproteobacteria bacterium]
MSIKTQWQQDIEQNLLEYDAMQEPIINQLNNLYHEILNMPKPDVGTSFLSKILKKKKRTPPPKGLYIWGSVGRGKSMMMDLFADQIQKQNTHKVARKHFHEFMGEVQHLLNINREKYRPYDNPLIPLAQELAQQHQILCFDEFQVTNIADAMILGRLFQALFDENVIVVATSNIAPEQLYKDGLHRNRFLPFIEILKQHMDVFEIGGQQDFRLRDDIVEDAWLWPQNNENKERLEQLFITQATGEGLACEIAVGSRKLPIIKACNQVAMVDYATLCREPRGTEDYSQLATHFHTIYIMNIPSLSQEGAASRRFIHLIDILYEKRIRLLALAETTPENLNPPQDDGFVFNRTLSRLFEMRSQDWQSNATHAWQGNKFDLKK